MLQLENRAKQSAKSSGIDPRPCRPCRPLLVAKSRSPLGNCAAVYNLLGESWDWLLGCFACGCNWAPLKINGAGNSFNFYCIDMRLQLNLQLLHNMQHFVVKRVARATALICALCRWALWKIPLTTAKRLGSAPADGKPPSGRAVPKDISAAVKFFH